MTATRNIIRLILTWPSILVGWGYVLLFTIGFAAHNWEFDKENLILTATWRPWVVKFWKYSTTLNRGIIYQPGADERTKAHEAVHVRQVEDNLLLSLSIAIAVLIPTALWVDGLGPWVLALCLWISGVAWQVPGFLGTVLRGGHVYRDAEHERSAFAQTDLHHVKSKSWLDIHLSRPQDW